MSAVIKELKKSELPFAYELTLADTLTGAELPLRVLRFYAEEHGFSVGKEIDDTDVEDAVDAARVCECAVAGAGLLAYTDNSVRRLARKLCARGYERDVADEAARALSRFGYIREDAQIERRGRALAERKLRGRRRVISDLCALGYDMDAIRSWDAGCSIDYASICARAIERRGGLPSREDGDREGYEAKKRRLLSYLYRQGFSGEDIRAAAALLRDKR